MTNVGCNAAAVMNWTETNIAAKMSSHKAYMWCLETANLMAFGQVTWGLFQNIPLSIKP